MAKLNRPDVAKSVRKHISDPGMSSYAFDLLRKFINETQSNKQTAFDAADDDQLDNVERLLAGLMTSVRIKRNAKDFAERPLTLAGESLLDRAREKLGLRMRWRDHVRMADTENGRAIVAEPYGLCADDFNDFVALRQVGWSVFVSDSRATHFPGHAVCVILEPPTMKTS